MTAKLCAYTPCRRTVDPDTDHHGDPHGGSRRSYCSLRCRNLARNDVRRAREAEKTAELRRREQALRDLRAAERAGRVAPLPGMPELPPAGFVAVGTPSA